MVESMPDEFTTASKTDPETSTMRRSIINFSNLRTAFLLISNRIRVPSTYHLANASSIYKHTYGSSMNQQQQGLRFLTFSRGSHTEPDPNHSSMMRKDGEDKDNQLPNDQKPVTPPPKPTFFPTWARWVLGSILTILLPFWKQKWEKLVAIEAAVEVAAEEIEVVAEEVEKVADVAEKFSEDVANDIPKDGPLKEAALFAERLSKDVAKEAHVTQEIIHTAEELKEEVENLIDPFGSKGKDAHEHK